MKKAKVLIAAGGSGGHIFPAIALAKALQKFPGYDVDIRFVGSNKALDRRIFEKEGFKFSLVSANKFPYKLSLKIIWFLIKFKIDCIKMFFAFLSYRPDVVVGFGGYVSCPVIVMAAIFRTPRIVHEQNVCPGRANKLLFTLADKVAVSFDQMCSKGDAKYVFTGNPIRSEVLKEDRPGGIKRFGLDESKFTILVVGGSQGAHFLNETFISAISAIDKELRSSLQVIHLTGVKDYEWAIKAYELIDGLQSRVFSFIDRIEEAYSASDLIVTRAGASAIFEAAYFARAMILVPYPFAMSHQSENAKVFSSEGAAVTIEENILSSEVFKDNILRLVKNKEELKKTGAAAKRLCVPDAAARLAGEVLKLNEKK
ncbi:MAG: undecaprenyldiphospho-muramoylpentapeptide beta-N-acetylglucosaminyltransferase [Candidatus Omnitrophota bacterium]